MDNRQKLDNEAQTRQLIQAALSVKAHPLRGDEIEALVQKAVVRNRQNQVFPLWALLVLTLGIYVIAVIAWQMGWLLNEVISIALLMPLINLIISPMAAYLIIKRSRQGRLSHIDNNINKEFTDET